jgi:hypothetical protein
LLELAKKSGQEWEITFRDEHPFVVEQAVLICAEERTGAREWMPDFHLCLQLNGEGYVIDADAEVVTNRSTSDSNATATITSTWCSNGWTWWENSTRSRAACG